MEELGTPQRPVEVNIHSQSRVEEILAICKANGWQIKVKTDSSKPEDISELLQLMESLPDQMSGPGIDEQMFQGPDDAFSMQFKFEPISYGSEGHFMPSIACLSCLPGSDEWNYHFVIALPGTHYQEEKDAFVHASKDLQEALEENASTGMDSAMAENLKAKGYIAVDNLNVTGPEGLVH